MALLRVGVYPGTFDPITSGHTEIVRRSLRLVDKLVIGPFINIGKGPLFSLQERIDIIKEDIEDFPQADKDRIQVLPYEGLLIHFAREVGATVIIRGLRAVSDFEYEFQMASMNAKLNPQVETLFLMAAGDQHFVSSRLVKEVGRLGGDITRFVSPRVAQLLKKRFAEQQAKAKS